ncbi:MAG: DNA repair exonuclease [Paenibacillaceae bacterium]|nr:DNA repair exonuclease [Paenibacillaceae bacterium]
MSGFRFVHAADLHLGSPFRGLSAQMPPAIRETVLMAGYEALKALVELTIRIKADFLVIAGDVYDAADRSLQAQIRFQQAMERLGAAGIPVFVAHGNHDPADGRSAHLRWPDNVRFFSSEQVESIPLHKRGEDRPYAHVYGMSYGTAEVTANLARGFRVRPGAPYHIAVLHANVDGEGEHANYAPCSLKELIHSGMNYWALGHVHTRRVLHEAPFVVYPGNLQGRSIRETGAKGCCVVEVDASGRTELTFHELDAMRWHTRVLSIDGLSSEQALKDALEAELEAVREEGNGRPAVIRFAIEGRGPLHDRLRQPAAVLELAAELRASEAERAERYGVSGFVWTEAVQAATGQPVDRESLLEGGGYLGDLLQLAAELAQDETALAGLCEEALAPLLAGGRTAEWLHGAQAADRLRWLAAAEELAIDALAGLAGERSASPLRSLLPEPGGSESADVAGGSRDGGDGG